MTEKRKRIGIFVVLCSMILLTFYGCSESTPASSDEAKTEDAIVNQTEDESSKEENQVSDTPTEETKEPVTFELSSGNYTAGIDYPSGKYNITALSGSGNVISDNMFDGGINAMMGTEDDELFEKEYKNIKLTEGTVLSVSGGVKIRIDCEKPESGVVAREQTNTETISLSNGNFVSGEDFPAGVYDVVATDGSGNVMTDNMYEGGLNAIMGVNDDSFSEKEYKNINLPEGVTLTISGVDINLVPSK